MYTLSIISTNDNSGHLLYTGRSTSFTCISFNPLEEVDFHDPRFIESDLTHREVHSIPKVTARIGI